MSRSRRESRLGKLFDSPFWNGLVTLAIILCAVYVSYTANNGLPFVKTYKVSVDVQDAGQLVRHAEVRVGGARVGQVLELHAVPRSETQPAHARLDLALDPDLEPLAMNSITEMRVASPLGGKYVGIVPGNGAAKLPEGAVLPLSRAKTAVDLDQGFRVFSPRVRRGLQETVTELGNAVAGRGVQFNNSIRQLAKITPGVERVLRLLADPSTNLGGFIGAAAATVETFVPLTDDFLAAQRDGGATFGAINAASPALAQTLDALPGAVSQTTTTLRHLRPTLRTAALVTRELRPTADLLPGTLRALDGTLRAAVPVARNARRLAPAMDRAFDAVNRFAASRDATNAIKALGANDLGTTGASALLGLGAIFRTLAEAQLNCNTIGSYARNVTSVLSEGNAMGAWLRTQPILDLASSVSQHSATPDRNLHFNPYPVQNANECEANNEPWAAGQSFGNVEGNQGKAHPVTKPPQNATRLARAAGLLEKAPR